MSNTPIKKSHLSVLFVCMGNICRSPAAEGIFQAMVEKAGLASRISCDSAGTIGFHSAQQPDSRVRSSAAKRGYHLTGRSRQIQREDYDRFDYIIAMDRENFEDINRRRPDGQDVNIRMMCDYAKQYKDTEVPDPYYGGQRGFEHVLDLLEDACSGLLEDIQAKLP